LDAKLQVLKSTGRLPVEYRPNRRAWMTSILFDEWLLKFDKQMRAIKHNFALLLDNCAAHYLNTAALTNMLVFFLPLNSIITTLLMNARVITNLKLH
jgi:hypothetical protein